MILPPHLFIFFYHLAHVQSHGIFQQGASAIPTMHPPQIPPSLPSSLSPWESLCSEGPARLLQSLLRALHPTAEPQMGQIRCTLTGPSTHTCSQGTAGTCSHRFLEPQSPSCSDGLGKEQSSCPVVLQCSRRGSAYTHQLKGIFNSEGSQHTCQCAAVWNGNLNANTAFGP